MAHDFKMIPKRLAKQLEEFKTRGRAETIPTTAFICQNIEKSPGDRRRIAVTQTPGKDNQLTLV